MALFGLLGGGGSDPMDIYGDLFTEKQRAALRDQQMTQGLLNAAAVFSKAGQASRLPVSIPWGEAAQALGGSGDEAMNRMLKGMQVAEEVRSSRQKRGFADQVAKFAQGLLEQEKTLGLPQGTLVKPYLAATGGAAGGAPASNAPPPPPAGPQPSTGTGAPEGLPGGATSAAGAEWLPNLPAGAAPTTAMPPPIYPLGDPNVPLSPRGTGGRAAGLLGPPAQDDPWAQYAGLLGGGTGSQSPFDPTTSDLTGPRGSPDRRIQIEQLSGEAAPVMPFPTRQDPNKPRSAWEQGFTYDAPKVPFGQDPGDALPGDSRLAALTRRYESGDRNITQQVNATGTAGGYYQITDPTWRDIAPKAGIDLEKYPTAISAPRAVQDAAAAALRQTRGMQPWSSNRPLMAAIGERGFSGRVEPLGGEAAPAGTAPTGKIPGLDISPQGLAALNMLSKLGGLGEPFGSLLETYYKSPGYLGEAARTKAEAEKGVALKYDPEIAAASAAATQKYIQENETHKSALDMARDLIGKGVYFDQATKTMKPITNAAEAFAAIDNAKEKFKSENEIVSTTVTLPGEGRPREIPMTRAQAANIAKGLAVPELGIPAMTGIKLGKPVYNPTETALGPIEAKAIFENHQLATDAATTIETNKQARALLDGGVITGFAADRVTAFTKLGNALGVTGRTSQEQVANTEAYLATTAGNVGRMIKQFGAGTGLSDADREYAAQMAAGRVTLDETSIRRILDINDRASLNIINRHNQRVSKIAPGATMTDLNVPVPTPYAPPETRSPAEGPAAAARAGAADAIAKGAPRDAVIKRLRDAGISTEGL